MQVSGSTIRITDESILPLHNLPVLYPALDLSGVIDPAAVATAIREAATRLDFEEGEAPLALAFRWMGDPSYVRLRALAEGIQAGVPRTIERGIPIVLLTDGDIGMSLGAIMKEELGTRSELVSVDGVLLQEYDFVDVGEVLQPAGVVPVMIKSLLFAGGMDRASVKRALVAAARSLA
jgi:ethanolamine utilization protein EutA